MANRKRSGLVAGLVMLFLIIVSGCTANYVPNSNGNNNVNANNNVNLANGDDEVYNLTLSGDDKLKKFSSSEELRRFLETNSAGSSYSTRGGFGMAEMSIDMAFDGEMTVKSASAESLGGSGASDYSETNVQVEGVDEADFVKNDGKYIYMLSNGKFLIVDAYPAESAKIISEEKIEGNPAELFLNGDKVVVFTTDYEERMVVSDYDFLPSETYVSVTKIFVFDVSDKENPDLVEEYVMDGYYYNSRMIGDFVYVISQESIYYYGGPIGIPEIWSGSVKIATPDVYYFDNPHDSYVFHTIAAIDLANDNELEAKTFMLGWGSTLYVSEDNVYVAYKKNYPYYFYRNQNLDIFDEVIFGLLPADVQDKIERFDKDDERAYREEVKKILDEMYNSMDEDDMEDLIEEIEDAVSDYEAKIAIERSKTMIHRISIDGLDIEHEASGEVRGDLLNQFSLDEYEGNLRVATTLSYWSRNDGSIQNNNVFVLGPDMDVIGSVDELAEGERIYSARFMGDKLYMVTFKQVDPLFVIDLSNPEKPEVLGELKVPGYSTYLHPFMEGYLIGVGMDTKESEFGGVVNNGVKVSLFDVREFDNPKEVDTYKIGLQGSSSDALNDHRAFLFDAKRNIMVIPVSEVLSEKQYERGYGYTREMWYGAYVFDVSEDGFDLKGKVEHEQDRDERYYWYSPHNVKRSLYLDNVLYTISEREIVMSDLDDELDEIDTIVLPKLKEEPNYPIYY